MLNADFLLGALQWALVVTGFAIIALTLTYVAPEGADQYSFTYADGTVVTGEPLVPRTVTDTAFQYLVGLGLGLLIVAGGAVVFCLRRIGLYLGDTVTEMRQIRNEES